MPRMQALLLVLVLGSGGARQLRAQTIELQPFVGYQGGKDVSDATGRPYDLRSHASFGLGIGIDLHHPVEIQALVSRQPTEARPKGFSGPTVGVEITHWMIGPAKTLRRRSRLRPSGAALIGFSHFATDEPGGLSVDWLSAAADAGLAYFPWSHLGLRVDVRGFFVFTNGGSPFGCIAPVGCALKFTGDVFIQPEAAVSAVFVFGRTGAALRSPNGRR
ncbi:MAG TPA: hypothetical protein VFW66_13685 [Gemmatimonadales bacterium]|nr:hypothetical protein [Gemmatimonadales bacterium]